MGTVFALLGTVVASAVLSDNKPAPRHSPFHVNCPPGRHVSNARAGFGAKLAQSRERAIELRLSQSRAITAGHPRLSSGGPQ